jgi:hypothetical protein
LSPDFQAGCAANFTVFSLPSVIRTRSADEDAEIPAVGDFVPHHGARHAADDRAPGPGICDENDQ